MSGDWNCYQSGLLFCPKPSQINQFQLEEDSFRKKYKWISPWKRDRALETYFKKVRDNIYCTLDKNSSKCWPYDNLSSIERKDLLYRDLGSILPLINQQIKVMPLWQCRDRTIASKVMSHLQNNELYCTSWMWTLHYGMQKEITSFLTDMMDTQVIDKETSKYLQPQDPRPCWFYILPKICKKGNPGRPIVSSCVAPTEKIS